MTSNTELISELNTLRDLLITHNPYHSLLPELAATRRRLDVGIDEECAICFEIPTRRGIVHPCGHTAFCKACITGLRECPLCRTRIDKIR